MNIKELVEKLKKEEAKEFSSDSILNKKPLVSVIIITYQHKDFIERCIESVIKQDTEFEYEVLIGDDGSEDGTTEVCLNYQRRYPEMIRFFVQSRKNVIFFGSRPTGRFNFLYLLSKARGRYIAMVEGDDYWADKEKLKIQVDCIKSHERISGCFHSAKIFEKDKLLNDYYGPPVIKDFYQTDDLLIYGNFIPTSSIFFKKDRIDDIPEWFLDVPVGDWPLNIILAEKGVLKFINRPMSVWRRHPGGVYSQRSNYFKLIIETRSLYVYKRNLKGKHQKYILNKIARNLLQLYLDFNVKVKFSVLRKYVVKSLSFSIFKKRLIFSNLKLIMASISPPMYKRAKRLKVVIKKDKSKTGER